MIIKNCIGLNGKDCAEFSTSETQLCEKHEEELKKKLERLENNSAKNK